MIHYICGRCGWPPGHGCPCVTDPLAVRRAQDDVTARHRAAVKLARSHARDRAAWTTSKTRRAA